MPSPSIRPYRPDNLPRLLDCVGAWLAKSSDCPPFHPGNVLHHMSNSLRGQDPKDWYGLVEDTAGDLIGIAVVYPPRYAGFGVLVAPEHRDSVTESALIDWAEARAWAAMQAAGRSADSLSTDVLVCDGIRQRLLEARGYTSHGPSFVYTTRPLDASLPDTPLPPGFHFSTAAELNDPDAVGACHASAFGSTWPAGAYAGVMAAPGFDPERELLVVAPDGRPAAFAVWWPDSVSRSALFEPVGCAAEFQRRGLTRALLCEGMRQMRAAGMITAIVEHEPTDDNPAAGALYASVGFTPRHTWVSYRKTMRSAPFGLQS